mgnify:FL=1
MEKTDHIALFIDLDNFVGCSIDDDLPLDIKGEIKKLTEHGRISIRRSFGDIMKLPILNEKKQELRQMLQANLVLHEDIPHYTRYKNTSDIRLAIEALSIAYTHPDINYFAVIANDRDYMPLFSKLKEIGKTIIGIGSTKESVGELYKSACDLFYYHSNLCGSNGAKNTNFNEGESESKIVQLLLETVEFNSINGKPTVGAAIAPAMRARKPDLDFKNYSFLSFGGLCTLAQKQNLIRTEPHGLDLNIFINDTSAQESIKEISADSLIKNQGDLKKYYNDFIKNILKIKTELPDFEKRKLIYRKTDELLSENPDGLPLKEISFEVTKLLNLKNDYQPVVYKILYTLYRSDSFTAIRTEDSFDPILQKSMISHSDMDNNLIKQIIKLFRQNESKSDFNPNVWSEVLKGDTSLSGLIKFYYNYE